MESHANLESLRAALRDPRTRRQTLDWVEGLRVEGGYRLWRDSPVHILPTSFAVFLRELLLDLPDPGSVENRRLTQDLLSWKGADGQFDRGLSSGQLGVRHDAHYVAEQQTHFALQALRLLGTLEPAPAHLLERWASRSSLRASFDQLDWRDPWRESNRVMFALYLLEHEGARTGDPLWRSRIVDGLDWLREHQDPATGCWGVQPARRRYAAVYGAYHYLFFFLHWEGAMPCANALLETTRLLQTAEGFFAHTRGGGACEDYDCFDVLVKLGDDKDLVRLGRAANAVWAARNPDGGFPWAKPASSGASFILGNWMKGLCLAENTRLAVQRTRDVLRRERRWRYSGLSELECPALASDLWSTWFRMLILAEFDDRWLHSGACWGFRRFPSLGWHRSTTAKEMQS